MMGEIPVYINPVTMGQLYDNTTFTEPAVERRPVDTRNIWNDVDQIPATPPAQTPFPGTAFSVVSGISGVVLTEDPGTPGSFISLAGEFLDMVPAGIDNDMTQYQPTLRDAAGKEIPYDPSVWVADGLLRRVMFTNLNSYPVGPLTIDYWRYTGATGGGSAGVTTTLTTPGPAEESLVVNGVGPGLTIRGLSAGTGITLASDGTQVTIGSSGSAPTGPAGGSLSGTYPNPTIAAGAVGATELAATAVTAAAYGSATEVATFTVDGDGRLTAAASTPIDFSGAGDVDGPGAATDNALARFDGPSGKLIQNSMVTLSDAGAMTGLVSIENPAGDLTLTPITGGEVVLDGDAKITGNLNVLGSTTTIDSETLLVEDNSIYLNNGYTSTLAMAGGVVANYLATAATDTVAAGGFAAGVAAVSNPAVATAGAATYSTGDLIQIKGAANPANNGLFEVLSHAVNVLTIRGVGVSGASVDFVQVDFATDATAAGSIVQVNVAVISSGTDGVWETAKGATSAAVIGGTANLMREGDTAGGSLSGTYPNPGIAAGAVGAAELAATTVTAASYGSATQVATFTVDADGRLTAAANTTIAGVAPGGAAGGDLTGTYPNPTLAATTVTAAAYGSATQVGTFTVDAKGRLTAAGNTTIAGVAPGGVAGGDLAGSYPNPTLAATAVSSGSYGSPTQVGTFTVDTKGRLTSAGNTTIAGVTPGGAAGGSLSGTYPNPGIAAGAVGATELAATTVTAAAYGSATQVATFTVDADGRLTAAANTTIAGVAPGGAAGGDLTGTYPNPTLATTTVTAAAYGSATEVATFTVDAKGRLTAAGNTTIAGVAPGGAAGGDLTGTYPNPTLATTAVTAAAYGSATEVATFTVDSKGRLTAAASTPIDFSSAGDVDGPGTATDNALARFDGATGKLIQNSVVTLSDTGAMTGVTGVENSGGDLTLTPAVGNAVVLAGDAKITGNLDVLGTTTTINSESLLVKDSSVYINNGYTSTAATAGGVVANYQATAVTDTVAAGGFTAGVAAVSNPTVATTGAATYSAGDLVQIKDADNVANNGLFEVLSHAANVLTIRGVGVSGTTVDFVQIDFVADTTVAGSIAQVNVAVISSGTDGVWETAKGTNSATVISDTANLMREGDAAGGSLSGTYPNPTIAAGAVGATELAATAVTAAAYGSATQVATFTVDADGRLTTAGNTTIAGVEPGGAAGGDLTGTYPNPTLTATAVTAGAYGSATEVGTFTVDAKGRLTAAGNVTITGAAPSGAAGGSLAGTYPNPTIAAGAVGAAELAATTVTAAAYGSATQVATFTVDADGRLTAAGNTTIAGVAPGGAAGGSLAGTYPNPTIAAGAVGATELAATTVTAAAYGSATSVATFTVDADGRLTAAASTPIDFSSAGDVDGPGTATDNALARFDGTTGKLIQNSAATLSDTGDLAVQGTTESTSIATGSIVAAGGAGIAKNVFVGGDLNVVGTTKTDTINELTPAAGITIEDVLVKDGTIVAQANTTTAISRFSAYSPATGTYPQYLTCEFGAPQGSGQGAIIFRDLTAEGSPSISCMNVARTAALPLRIASPSSFQVDNATNSTSTATGSIVTAGGAGIASDVYIGGTLHVDTINEKTAAAGVTVEGVVAKDSYLVSNNSDLATISKTNTFLKGTTASGFMPAIIAGPTDSGDRFLMGAYQGKALISALNSTMTGGGQLYIQHSGSANVYVGFTSGYTGQLIVQGTGGIQTNKISEYTAAAGVNIDSLLVKDGAFTAKGTTTSSVSRFQAYSPATPSYPQYVCGEWGSAVGAGNGAIVVRDINSVGTPDIACLNAARSGWIPVQIASDSRLIVANATASTTTTTGALTVAGGVGIAGALYAATGAITTSLTVGSKDVVVRDAAIADARRTVWDTAAAELQSAGDDTNIIWVTKDGNDTTGDGQTWETSYLTIAKALAIALSGETIYIGPGTYVESIGSASGVNIHGPSAHIQGLVQVSDACDIVLGKIENTIASAFVNALSYSGTGTVNVTVNELTSSGASGNLCAIVGTGTINLVAETITSTSGGLCFRCTAAGAINATVSQINVSATTTLLYATANATVNVNCGDINGGQLFADNTTANPTFSVVASRATITSLSSIAAATSATLVCGTLSGTFTESGAGQAKVISPEVFSADSTTFRGDIAITSTKIASLGGALNIAGGAEINENLHVAGDITTNSISFDSGTNLLSAFVQKTAWSPSITVGPNLSAGLGTTTIYGFYMRIGSLVMCQVQVGGMTTISATTDSAFTFTLPVSQSAGAALVGGNGYVYYGAHTNPSREVAAIQDNSGGTTNVAAFAWTPQYASSGFTAYVYCQYFV